MRVREPVRGGGVQQPVWVCECPPGVQMPLGPRAAAPKVRVQDPRGVGDVRCPAKAGGCVSVSSRPGDTCARACWVSLWASSPS